MKYFCVPFLIAYHLDGYELIVLVVETFEDLPKGAFPDHFEHFKPVANMVMQHLEEQEGEHSEYLNGLRTSVYIIIITIKK